MYKRFPKRSRVITNEEEDVSAEASTTTDDDVTQINDHVYFYADVKPKTVLLLLKAIHAATSHALANTHYATDAKVYLYINSNGGEVFSGLSAMDHIRLNRIPIVTIADGFVASAATLILLGGTERKILKNAKILIHQLSTQFWGKFNDLLDEVANSEELMNNFKSVYSSQTYMKEAKIEALLHKELHMNAAQALEYGFVDEVW